MSRNINGALLAEYSKIAFMPFVAAMLVFKTDTRYVWSGVGPLVWNGLTFTGVGNYGTPGPVGEGTDVRAQGTSVNLSGFDPTLLAEALTDIQVGAPAKLWCGALQNGSIVGTPYNYFSGTIDKPEITVSGVEAGIQLALENRMVNHSRSSQRKFTTNDQHANGYADDTAFSAVELQNDIVLQWGG